MEQQRIIISDNLARALCDAIAECPHDKLFVLCDETTRDCCWPLVSGLGCLQAAQLITIHPTDLSKSIDSVCHVWRELQRYGATRHSLMVNLGGGMVTDLGGFAASTFKRGIGFINIPTTLLAMVDASVGGKTGFNFGGLKNEIGVFRNANSVILDTTFLKTLDRENILSGYAEMLKHGLIATNDMWAELLTIEQSTPNTEHAGRSQGSTSNVQCSRSNVQCSMFNVQCSMIEKSVAVKQRIVTEDPTERGIRKALNLGHTAGHAFESLALENTQHPTPITQHPSPLLHGYAVAYGLVVELYLSCMKTGFPTAKMRQTVSFIKDHYGRMAITCDDYPRLLELMHHDKKNRGRDIIFTLLADIGDIRIDQTATEDEIREALDFYREY